MHLKKFSQLLLFSALFTSILHKPYETVCHCHKNNDAIWSNQCKGDKFLFSKKKKRRKQAKYEICTVVCFFVLFFLPLFNFNVNSIIKILLQYNCTFLFCGSFKLVRHSQGKLTRDYVPMSLISSCG